MHEAANPLAGSMHMYGWGEYTSVIKAHPGSGSEQSLCSHHSWRELYLQSRVCRISVTGHLRKSTKSMNVLRMGWAIAWFP